MSHSTSGTGPAGGERQGRQFDPVSAPRPAGTDPASAPNDPDAPRPTGSTDPASSRRRPPLWLLVLAGVLVVGLVVTAVLVLNRKPVAQPEALDPEVVTLALPTPTIAPIAREAGTALFDTFPATVLAYVLTEAGEHPPLIGAGALEGYRLVYSDGGATTFAVYAGQWATPEAAAASYQGMVAGQTAEFTAAGAGDGGDAEGDESASPTASPTEVEEGAVQVDGTEVGRYTLVPRADGTGTLTWTNGTVLLLVEGPAAALRDFHAAFTL